MGTESTVSRRYCQSVKRDAVLLSDLDSKFPWMLHNRCSRANLENEMPDEKGIFEIKVETYGFVADYSGQTETVRSDVEILELTKI